MAKWAVKDRDKKTKRVWTVICAEEKEMADKIAEGRKAKGFESWVEELNSSVNA